MNRIILLIAFMFLLMACTSTGAWAGEPAFSHSIAGPPKLRPGVPSSYAAVRPSQPLFSIARPDHGALVLTVDPAVIKEMKAAIGPVRLEAVPLGVNRIVSMDVERFHVTLPTTQFVVGNAGEEGEGGSEPFHFDADSIVLLRGRVVGDLNSHVYLALSEHMTNGIIECGLGRFAMTSRGASGAKLAPWEVVVFEALTAGPNPAPFCHLDDDDDAPPPHEGAPPAQPLGAPPVHGLRQIQLAIETDFEFYQIFNDRTAAATYVVQLYGAASDIFMRDINTRVDLTFVRIWDTPTEPFVASLSAFQNYWINNMQLIPRDVAQMFSGRGDLPGGVAYVEALCGNSAYSFCGNPMGFFAGVEQSSVYNYDLLVSAHELGHNFGTFHTHDYDLDTCNEVSTPPQRGTLMSYCSQTVSGGNSVMEMAFHKVTQEAMRKHVYDVPCVVFDCNQNGISDATDITSQTSPDANFNTIPDECEDCNNNGVLDPEDILFGFSADVNGNGIPDSCEPDCNGNKIPDLMDIQFGMSLDVHGNNIPDECEPDCDNNGTSDYSQIMLNMTLDKNRNVMLDSCEDCDGDGLTDLVELDGAWDVWAASNSQNVIREYHAVTGVLMDTSSPGQVSQASDLIIAPGRRVLVSSTAANRVVEFDDQGNFVGNLVAAGVGALSAPAGMVVSRNNTLLVASTTNHRVLEYNLTTGAFIGNFVAPGSGGLTQPFALVYGPDGNLYVSSNSNQVFRYNGLTGAFISIFVSSLGNGGLNTPRGMAFKPGGNLLVTSFGNDSVREYNGTTGAYVKNWAIVGVAFDGPWCIRMAPNGFVHISANQLTESHLTKARIHEFNVSTGNWVRGYVQGADTLLQAATGFDYLPGDATDCNQNQVPDNCDITAGFSADINHNGIPDECEPPICIADIAPPGGNNQVNVDDLLAVINSWGPCPGCPADIAPPGGNGVVNTDDLLAVINAWGPCPP